MTSKQIICMLNTYYNSKEMENHMIHIRERIKLDIPVNNLDWGYSMARILFYVKDYRILATRELDNIENSIKLLGYSVFH